ncbi:MAG: hypothetical protein AAFX76_08825, partial [Planctomycetota bacterium]
VLVVAAEPGLNAEGQPMGASFERSLTFFPPRIALQGNVGLGEASRIDLTRDGRTSVMVKLPAAPLEAVTLTVTPLPHPDAVNPTTTENTDAADPGIADSLVTLNDQTPGEPLTVTLDRGRRVAVFTARGVAPGVGRLRVEAPGYVAAVIDTYVEGASLTAAVDTP